MFELVDIISGIGYVGTEIGRMYTMIRLPIEIELDFPYILDSLGSGITDNLNNQISADTYSYLLDSRNEFIMDNFDNTVKTSQYVGG